MNRDYDYRVKYQPTEKQIWALAESLRLKRKPKRADKPPRVETPVVAVSFVYDSGAM